MNIDNQTNLNQSFKGDTLTLSLSKGQKGGPGNAQSFNKTAIH